MGSPTITAELVALDALSASHRERWRAFRAARPMLASPYFALEFAETMAAVRADTRALVVHRDGRVAGFLPLHLSRSGVARPIGGPLGDHHGLIAEDPALDLEAALAGAGIGVFAYHGALSDQLAFSRNAMAAAEISWVSDLRAGYDRYLEDCVRADAKAMRNIRARQRKLAELGDRVNVRVEDMRPEALDAFIACKREQYRRTQALDVFAASWPRRLIDSLFRRRDTALRGVLSTLEIDGQLAAAHFGMRSETVLHYWFPVYWPEHARLGPGLSLYLEIARALCKDGIDAIHLGPGDYDFKRRLSNSAFDVVSGHIDRPSLASAVVGAGQTVDRLFQALPLGRASYWPRKAFRRMGKWAAVHAL